MDNKGSCVMGIDASLTHTGVAVISLADGVYMRGSTCNPKTKGVIRLRGIESWLNEFINDIDPIHHLAVRMAVMEGYAYTPAAGQAFSLGELGGVIKVFMHESDIRLLTVQPPTLKKWVTGEGKGDKNLMLVKAFKKWNIEFTNDHECDAYALANIGWSICKVVDKVKDIKSFYDYEQEVLKVVMKQLEEK